MEYDSPDYRAMTAAERREEYEYELEQQRKKDLAIELTAKLKTKMEQNQWVDEDALDAARWSEIGKSIERACGELPEDFEITIHLENGAGTVVLLYPNGEECENFPHDDGFAGVVNAATDAAIAAAKEIK